MGAHNTDLYQVNRIYKFIKYGMAVPREEN